MAVFYGTKISPHITSLTDGGYLLCSSVPIARTGPQLYLPSEIEFEGAEELRRKDGLIEVFREPEEVFSERTVASFAGKPVTDGHPMDPVNADNHAVYSKGTVMGARRGTGEYADCILADLLISDSSLIDEIANGKRGISAGYGCRYEIKDGRLCQTDIICNHVAVVKEGRAGKRVEIRDESPGAKIETEKETVMEEEKKDVASEAKLAGDGCAGRQCGREQGAADSEAPEDPMEKVMKALEDITARLDALEAKKNPDALDALEEELTKGAGQDDPVSDEEAVTVSPDEMNGKEDGHEESDPKDAILQFIRKIKPVVASISDAGERRKVTDEMGAALKGVILRGGMEPREDAYKKITRDRVVKARVSFGESCRSMHPKYNHLSK
jgi:hypothetical protein